VWRALAFNDVVQGLLKPFIFGMIISLVGCYFGLQTTGGTQGVGRSTTQAVVTAQIWIIVVTFFIGRIFVNL
jgi:phospholipid/cholesterol/gamma-HCH transport system permease protein